jgi:electron transfer flavoprotein alpha subunit
MSLGNADDALVSGASAVADRVVVASGPVFEAYNPETYLSALAGLCKAASATVVLLGNDTYGQEIAARLASARRHQRHSPRGMSRGMDQFAVAERGDRRGGGQ